MLLSELKIYEFFKEKLKFHDADAKKYAKEMTFAEEKLTAEIKGAIASEIKLNEFATRSDMWAVKQDIHEARQDVLVVKNELLTSISQVESKMERGFRNIILWMISFISAIIGGGIALAKLCLP